MVAAGNGSPFPNPPRLLVTTNQPGKTAAPTTAPKMTGGNRNHSLHILVDETKDPDRYESNNSGYPERVIGRPEHNGTSTDDSSHSAIASP